MLFYQFDATEIGGGQAVLVDDHRQPFQPHFPTFGGDIFVNALTQRSRVRGLLKPDGLPFQDLTKYCAWHIYVPGVWNMVLYVPVKLRAIIRRC